MNLPSCAKSGPGVTRIIDPQEENTRIDADLRLGNTSLCMLSEAQNREKTIQIGPSQNWKCWYLKDIVKKVRR